MLDDVIRQFLAHQRIARLATSDASGRPHVVPICYVVVGNVLYSVIDRKPKRRSPPYLRRVQNIQANPRVAVVIDVYREDWSQLAYVLIEGQASLISAGEEHTGALAALSGKYPQYREMPLEDRPVIAVTIERITSWGNLATPHDRSP